MRYRLRTLLIVLAIGPMVLALAYSIWTAPEPSPWLIDEDFDFIPPRGWNLRLQEDVNRKIEAVNHAGRYPFTNNRP